MATTNAEVISSYITDMIALESHLAKALAGQIEDLDKDNPSVVAELRGIHQTTQTHISALEAIAERRQSGAQDISEAVKRAGSALLGLGAAAVDFLRTEKLPKNLRDDYTAVSLASIGYVMLHTTALSLDDAEVADLAHRHLQDHARCTMTLHNLIPGVVVRFLQEEGLPARTDVLTKVAKNIEAVWKDESGVPQADDLVAGGSGRAKGWSTGEIADRGSPSDARA
jgi:ferritin-like metal-binding protein YciE